MGLTMCLTNTGGSHTGLDTSYARIPADMVYIANLFDKGVLADVDPKEFYSKGWDPANRPVRRAMHFFGENERVPKMRDALKAGDGETYMRLMNESGRSSEQLLNNIVTSATGDTKLEQGLELLLDAFVDGALAEAVAAGNKKGGHQRFAVSEQRERERGDVVGAERVKLCGVRKDDGQHTGTLQHVEHADGVDGAGSGAFHEKGPPCAPFVPEAPEGRVLGAINENMKLGGELFCQMI